jgi:hypothetical protein
MFILVDDISGLYLVLIVLFGSTAVLIYLPGLTRNVGNFVLIVLIGSTAVLICVPLLILSSTIDFFYLMP